MQYVGMVLCQRQITVIYQVSSFDFKLINTNNWVQGFFHQIKYVFIPATNILFV